MTMRLTMICNRCLMRWWQKGSWPHVCPFCHSDRIRPVTPMLDGRQTQ